MSGEIMWNYRVVRRKHSYEDQESKKFSVYYTYAIHEAFYDDNGHVGMITQDPIEPFGDNIEELRHSWVMMAEAFGRPILDYDNIPEPGCAPEDEEDELIPWEEVEKELEEEFGSFDEEQYRKDVENERLKKEKIHQENFIGEPTLEKLIGKIFSDYKQSIERDKVNKPKNQ